MAKKLSKKKLEEFRKILLEKKKTLVNEAVETMGDLTESQENYADMTDQASAEMDRNFLLRVRDRERKLIMKINSVIAKIDDGTYGVCDLCGDLISEARLLARPETTQCIECKTDMEEMERKAKMVG
ncbi:MAG TPA: RNA polymerase-binding protein DksA [Oligoflexia bacterium]|nr:RNA polymerase-binding protein DksA [Oligoflexia bacterium]HMR25021.1 RNA polymerase-binding protein DksA [Oligoflexia bacterium]